MAIVEHLTSSQSGVEVHVLTDDVTGEYVGVRVKGGEGKLVSVVLEDAARQPLTRGEGVRGRGDTDIALPSRLTKAEPGKRGRPFGISVSVF